MRRDAIDGRESKRERTSTVRDGLLLTDDTMLRPSMLVVGSQAWFTWLETATAFIFRSAEGHYTARKERYRRGGWYWKAYRSVGGKLHRAYLGKSATLDLAQLTKANTHLNEQIGKTRTKGLNPQDVVITDSDDQTTKSRRRGSQNKSDDHPTLLTAKLSPPALPTTLVSRPRLLHWLDRASERPLAVITGAAGSGKSTLLADWTASRTHRRAQIAWMQLDQADSDPARFWRSLFAAFERVQPSLGSPGLALMDHGAGVGSAPVPTDELVAVLLDEVGKLAQPLWVILDDYHYVTAQTIHDALATLAAHLPATGHVIIGSREEVPFITARLQAYERVITLGPGELRFTDAEAQEYLSARLDVRLAEADISTLNAGAEGWITGLQLAALAMEQMPQAERSNFVDAFTQGRSAVLVDYLVEEVVERQEPSVRDFILRTSVLDQLCGPLCDALVDGRGSQALLERLARSHVFLIELDSERRWYRYHHLFAEVVRKQVSRDHPELISSLQVKAALWHVRHGNAEDAVPYALASGDFALAADVIERVAPQLERWGEAATLLRWLTAVPNEIMRKHPLLCLVHARLLLVAGQIPQAQASAEMAEKALLVHGREDRIPRGLPAELSAQLLALRSDLLMVAGDYRGALAVAQGVYTIEADIGAWRAVLLGAVGALHGMVGEAPEGLRAYREAEIVSRAAGDIPSLLENLFGQGSMLGTLGQLREAAAVYRLAVDIAETQPAGPPPVAGASYWNLARTLYEWDEREVAWQPLRESLRLNRRYGDLALLARCYLVQGRLYQAQGEVEGVRETQRQLEELAASPQVRPLTAKLAAAMVARLALAQGDLQRAEEWESQSGLATTDPLGYRTEFGHMTLLRLLLAREHYDAALSFASRLLQDAENTGRIDKVIELCMLHAISLEACESHREAEVSLARSLALAERGGYLRLFVDEARRLGDLLEALLTRSTDASDGHPSQRYLQRLLVSINPETTTLPKQRLQGDEHSSLDHLSQREIEVLARVDAGLSDAEIADELVVELSTVKWHLRNIFQKLGARRRTQALAKARSLGLL